MIWLLRDFDLLSVLLRALTLGLELLTLGGVAYLLLVAMPASAGESALAGCWRGIRWAAASFAIVEVCYVAVDSAILMGSSSLGIADLVAAPYFLAGVGPRWLPPQLLSAPSLAGEGAGRDQPMHCCLSPH